MPRRPSSEKEAKRAPGATQAGDAAARIDQRNIGAARSSSARNRTLWQAARRHDITHVLERLRKLMAELSASVVGPNFRLVEYLDKRGQMRPVIEFSEDVLTAYPALLLGSIPMKRASL